MDAASDIPGSPVAWNGLFLTVPDDWIPATIDTRYLFFTCNDLATLECKWTPESGAVSMQRKRTALEKQLQRTEGFTFAPAAIPSYWTEALQSVSPDFEVLPFTHAMGNGALCLHLPSNSTVLLHCYITSPDRQEELRSVLASLNMAKTDASTPFAINDILFTIPAAYELKKAEFKPGHSILMFTHGKCTLTIQRIAPANIVLQGRPFRAWIKDALDVPLKNIHKDKTALPRGARKRYSWHLTAKPSLLQRLSGKSGRMKSTQGTAWISENENKLIVVTLESALTTTCDTDAFTSVWRSVRLR